MQRKAFRDAVHSMDRLQQLDSAMELAPDAEGMGGETEAETEPSPSDHEALGRVRRVPAPLPTGRERFLPLSRSMCHGAPAVPEEEFEAEEPLGGELRRFVSGPRRPSGRRVEAAGAPARMGTPGDAKEDEEEEEELYAESEPMGGQLRSFVSGGGGARRPAPSLSDARKFQPLSSFRQEEPPDVLVPPLAGAPAPRALSSHETVMRHFSPLSLRISPEAQEAQPFEPIEVPGLTRLESQRQLDRQLSRRASDLARGWPGGGPLVRSATEHRAEATEPYEDTEPLTADPGGHQRRDEAVEVRRGLSPLGRLHSCPSPASAPFLCAGSDTPLQGRSPSSLPANEPQLPHG